MQDQLILPANQLATISGSEVCSVAQPVEFGQLPNLAVRRILLPFDLSRASVCALRVVANFAETVGATVHLLYVVRPADTAIDATQRSDDGLPEDAERLLKHWVKRVIKGRVQTFVSIRIGEPVDVIIARAAAMHADLIVMTSRSCSGLKNELQRSSAERVSRLAQCPVLTIPEKCASEIAYSFNSSAHGKAPIILVPVDFSKAAEQALRFAAAAALQNGATLLLAHGTDTDDPQEPATHARIRLWAEELLDEAVPFETAVWPGGHSLYAILSEALRAEAGLIVLPTRVQPWTQRLRAGSITDGVLRQAPCPILSISENISANDN